MSARDELALELFTGDNGNQPREQSIADWGYFHAEEMFQGRTEHYKVMADAILAAGYRKPRTITTAEELDALASGSVILDSSGEPNVLHDNGWVLPGGPGGYTTWAVAQSLPATVLYEPTA